MVRTLRNGGCVSIAVLALGLGAPAIAQTTPPATTAVAPISTDAELGAAIREALARDPDVRTARAELGVAEVEGDIARNGYLPALNASAGPESSGVGYDVSLSQTLYDWGQVRSTIDRADALKDR